MDTHFKEMIEKENYFFDIAPLTFDRARIIFTDGDGVEQGW